MLKPRVQFPYHSTLMNSKISLQSIKNLNTFLKRAKIKTANLARKWQIQNPSSYIFFIVKFISILNHYKQKMLSTKISCCQVDCGLAFFSLVEMQFKAVCKSLVFGEVLTVWSQILICTLQWIICVTTFFLIHCV